MKTRGQSAAVRRGRALQPARLKAIKDDILAHIAGEQLSVTDIARRHGITTRSVRLLFEADGETFSGYVTEQRLNWAYRMLIAPAFCGRTVSSIAFEAGFGDISYFNRTFRRRYGAAPSDVRKAAQRENGGS